MKQITTVNRSVDDLVFAEHNPRRMSDDQYKHLRESISWFGVVDPIIINVHPERMNIIIGGHQRVRIARELGIRSVPCVEIELSPEKERELNIRLNKNLGEWDWERLADLFAQNELLDWGFTQDELQSPFTEELEEKSENLKPYSRVHVLISFAPDIAVEVRSHIDALSMIEGVGIEQSAN